MSRFLGAAARLFDHSLLVVCDNSFGSIVLRDIPVSPFVTIVQITLVARVMRNCSVLSVTMVLRLGKQCDVANWLCLSELAAAVTCC